MKYNSLFQNSSISEIVREIEIGDLDFFDPFKASETNFSLLNDQYQAFCCSVTHDISSEVRKASCPSEILPLNGIPFGIKDIFNTKVMPTTMGSPIWEGYIAGNNARCVDSLLRRGALSFGKTVTAEFAVHSLNATLNPYDVTKTPGTSSSGSAVAVALGIVPFALGTQTAGSIVRPASFCGVWGFKPSFGLIPRTGVLKTTDSLDTVGFFSYFGSDLRRILSSIRVSGMNYPNVFKKVDSRGAFPKSKGMTWKIGILYSSFWADSANDIKSAFKKIVSLLENDKSFELELIDDQLLDKIHDNHAIIYEKSLSYYFMEEYKTSEHISPIMREMIEKGKSITSKSYLNALRVQANNIRDIGKTIERYDAILTISTATSAPNRNDLEKEDPSLAFTFLGMPSLHVPYCLDTNNMPIGFQITSARYNDYLILQLVDLFMKKGFIRNKSISFEIDSDAE